MDTLNIIKNIIMNEMGFVKANLKLDSNFKNDIGMDSLDMVELTVRAENQFNIDIDDEAAIKINTIQDLVSFVNDKTTVKLKS